MKSFIQLKKLWNYSFYEFTTTDILSKPMKRLNGEFKTKSKFVVLVGLEGIPEYENLDYKTLASTPHSPQILMEGDNRASQ